jgi:hypothetical protein
MRDQRTPGHEPDDPIQFQRAALDLLVHDHPGLWSLAELDRVLKPGGDRDASTCHVEDVVADLYAAGLVHRCGEFVFATRAAAAAERIGSC